MADISMCANHDCPSAKQCYRHEAQPNPWRQSYGMFTPNYTGKCEDFSPIRKVKRRATPKEPTHDN